MACAAERQLCQPGAPWGGVASILQAVHENNLARKGCSKPAPHQRCHWSRAVVYTAPDTSGDASPAAASRGGPATEPARPRSAMLPAPCGHDDGAASRLGPAAAARPAGLSAAEVRGRPPRPVHGPEHPSYDSAGFVSQLEVPGQVLQAAVDSARLVYRLEKTALDEIRADHSASEQLRRGRVQSAVLPGPQPAPELPKGAVPKPAMIHPRGVGGGQVFQRHLWPGAKTEHSPAGASRSWSSSPRWAPVRVGQSAVRLQRVSALDSGGSRVQLPTKEEHKAAKASRVAARRAAEASSISADNG